MKKNEDLKNVIIKSISIEKKDENSFKSKIKERYQNSIQEINENSNIQLITKNKNEKEILDIIDDLIKITKNKII